MLVMAAQVVVAEVVAAQVSAAVAVVVAAAVAVVVADAPGVRPPAPARPWSLSRRAPLP